VFFRQQLDTATEELRFMCGLCPDVITRTLSEVNLVKKGLCFQKAVARSQCYWLVLERWNIKVSEDKYQAIWFSHRLRAPDAHLTLSGRIIPFVDHVKYMGVIFYKRITRGLYIEIIEPKTIKTFIRIYSLFKSEPLSTNIKLNLHTALIRSVMTYACAYWELAADAYLLKLQRLQIKVLRITANFSSCTPVRDLHMAINLPRVYDYVTKWCRQQAEILQNYENGHVRSIGQGEIRQRKYKRFKLGGGQAYDCSSD
jgi:hypothetical protein